VEGLEHGLSPLGFGGVKKVSEEKKGRLGRGKELALVKKTAGKKSPTKALGSNAGKKDGSGIGLGERYKGKGRTRMEEEGESL